MCLQFIAILQSVQNDEEEKGDKNFEKKLLTNILRTAKGILSKLEYGLLCVEPNPTINLVLFG